MRRSTLPCLILLAACAVQPVPRMVAADTGMADPPRLVLPQPLRAVGTEPFWAAIVAGDTLTYRTPEDQAGARIAVTRGDSPGESTFVGRIGGGDLRLRVTAGPCSDGMSDIVYPFTAELTIGGDRRQGCALPDRAKASAPGG